MDYTPNDRQLAQASITWRLSDRTDITAIGIYQHDKNPPNYNIVPLVASIYARPGESIPDSRFFGEQGINKGDKQYPALRLLANHHFSDAPNFPNSHRHTCPHPEKQDNSRAHNFGQGPPT